MINVLNRLATISRISMEPPQPRKGRHGLAIVAIVKNESRYIEEWVQFHISAGVRKFYIYDNGSTDDTLDILNKPELASYTQVIPWSQNIGDGRKKNSAIHNQVLAYAHAASNFGANFRWFAYIDVDEFLIPKQQSNLNDALKELEQCYNISLPWHMFGTSGHKQDPGGAVVDNYKERYFDPETQNNKLRNFKCIVDPCALTLVRVHSMQTNGEWQTSNDQGLQSSIKNRTKKGFYSSSAIQLNHYYTRSEQEFVEKMNKGHIIKSRSARYAEKLPAALQLIDSNVVEDVSAFNFKYRHQSL